MRRFSLMALLTLLLLGTSVTQAAPAPPPRVATAEVVVALWEANGPQVAKQLHSTVVLDAIARSKKAQTLGCITREKSPAEWLAGRLKTSIDEKRRTLTIRVEDCPRRDVLGLLGAVVEVYTSRVCPERAVLNELQMRQAALLRIRARVNGAVPAVQLADERTRIRALETKMKALIVQPPRLVR